MKAKKFALILVAVLIAALLAGCLAACNKDEKPVLTVTIGNQQVPYSPDGVQPYTDGTQVQVDGLPDGYTIELGLSAQFGGVPVPGDSAPLVFDGNVKVMNGETDVTGEFDIKATLTEGATVTVVKAVAEVNAVTEVEWDGEAHTFDVSDVVLPEGCDQQFTVNGLDKTYTDGGIYAYELVLGETDLYAAQTLEALLKIKSVTLNGKSYALEDAIAAAKSGDDIIVCHDTIFSSAKTYADASYRTIDKGVKFVLPFDEKHSTSVNELWKNRDTKTSIPDPYVTLEVPAGMQIVVDGTFIVNGRRTASGNIMGFTYENAVLNMNADSEVLVNDGGKFYSIGFVTGDGLIRAKSGGMIGETIVLLGYRGGSITTGIYNTIVPFNQYMLNNIEVECVYEAGAELKAQAFAMAFSTFGVATEVDFVGTDDAMIVLTSGELRKTYNVETGVITMTSAGDMKFGNLAVTAGVTVSSAGKEIPFPGNFDIVIESGKATLDGVRIKLLPGASLRVEKDATLELKNDAAVFVYNGKEFTWPNNDGNIGYPVTKAVYRTAPTFDYNLKTAAAFVVNGTVNVADTSDLAGVITSDANGKVVFAADPVEFSITELETAKSDEDYEPHYMTMTNIATLAGVEKVVAGTYTYNAETATWTKA